jgi:hypothetical protein
LIAGRGPDRLGDLGGGLERVVTLRAFDVIEPVAGIAQDRINPPLRFRMIIRRGRRKTLLRDPQQEVIADRTQHEAVGQMSCLLMRAKVPTPVAEGSSAAPGRQAPAGSSLRGRSQRVVTSVSLRAANAAGRVSYARCTLPALL